MKSCESNLHTLKRLKIKLFTGKRRYNYLMYYYRQLNTNKSNLYTGTKRRFTGEKRLIHSLNHGHFTVINMIISDKSTHHLCRAPIC